MTVHLLHAVRMLDVFLEFATQPMLVVHKGMVHLQPGTAVASYSKLKLLHHNCHIPQGLSTYLQQLLPQYCGLPHTTNRSNQASQDLFLKANKPSCVKWQYSQNRQLQQP